MADKTAKEWAEILNAEMPSNTQEVLLLSYNVAKGPQNFAQQLQRELVSLGWSNIKVRGYAAYVIPVTKPIYLAGEMRPQSKWEYSYYLEDEKGNRVSFSGAEKVY